ncbi:MAG: LL-diaminopimelate aminotransferase [Clostridium sp.]|uniref:LL-diaminopimelate aminotransferase n=1 Tax=Clostridium sp. DSM 8431 TaxID=1761781 RepID=UPI0008E0187C|nr:LL-diaminopimelate aminotransferase [Clostridium sp. DSM 8431]MCR4943648.1 LL-diaminopimelate aminotransferase [Clostridium sp.]SFU49274.1 LL-diaminopimelate aminotransferase apoenzyme [Clostridium sp. DSM 8431]
MLKINKNYLNLKESYLFSNIAHKVSEYKEKNPDKNVISLGIGDVVLPLAEPVIEALKSGVEDMAKKETFHGYGPEQGYAFLRETLQDYYKRYNVELEADEIFVSDGAKSDLGNILDLFDKDNVVLIPDPVYPAYVDTNVMDGRKIIFSDSNIENNFLSLPDYNVKADIIYICSPNNPTGAVYDREGLTKWVEYAKEIGALILFDAAYEAFIGSKEIPHSIYEIPGAKECAVEICSLSKTAGFTGLRCGYTIVPHTLKFDGVELNKLWLRRQTTKYNGVPYIVQKAAAGVFTEEGLEKTREVIAYYKENARIIGEALKELNIRYIGGENSPYIWLKCPNNMKSWDFFDVLLEEANIVGTPGAGFGENGEGYFRLSCFAERDNVLEAVKRIKELKF